MRRKTGGPLADGKPGVPDAAGNGQYQVAADGRGSSPRSKVQRRSQKNGHASNWAPATEPRASEAPQGSHAAPQPATHSPGIRSQLGNLALLILLYLLQGVPMGLTMGAMPFMLQSRLSYSQLGTFSLAALPYSLKLFWSPIVDSVYSKRMGRRKTWIVPIQFCVAFLLLACSTWIARLYEAADVNTLTALFFLVVLLAATQDIAVDGWALTLLPPEHVAWAATCQTLGTSSGFFTSFTVFLALQDAKFCNKYVRSWTVLQRTFGMAAESDEALVTLVGYLRFWGVFFAVVTALLWLLKPERDSDTDVSPAHTTEKQSGTLASALKSVREAYWALWGVLKLRAVWGLMALLLTCRLGVLTTESAASIKLMEKGVPKETLAAMVLGQFPIELVSALLAGRWAAVHSPTAPFLVSYFLRLAICAASVWLLGVFPNSAGTLPLASTPFLLLGIITLLSSAISSLSFTSMGTIFNTVSDPEMGGAYLTLLNTLANMGGTIPRAPAFYLMDALTKAQCLPPADQADNIQLAAQLHSLHCPARHLDGGPVSECTAAGGVCTVVRDGFFVVSWASLAVGFLCGLVYLRYLPKLLKLPLSAWRAQGHTGAAGSEDSGKKKQ